MHSHARTMSENLVGAVGRDYAKHCVTSTITPAQRQRQSNTFTSSGNNRTDRLSVSSHDSPALAWSVAGTVDSVTALLADGWGQSEHNRGQSAAGPANLYRFPDLPVNDRPSTSVRASLSVLWRTSP